MTSLKVRIYHIIALLKFRRIPNLKIECAGFLKHKKLAIYIFSLLLFIQENIMGANMSTRILLFLITRKDRFGSTRIPLCIVMLVIYIRSGISILVRFHEIEIRTRRY